MTGALKRCPGFVRVVSAGVVAHDVGTAAAQLKLVRAPKRICALALIDGVYGGAWAMVVPGLR